MSIDRFAQILAGPDPALDEACLAIAASLHGPLDEIEWLAALDMLAGECPSPTAAGVVRFVVDDVGFGGNTTDYYDWRNSCLDEVIRRRVGIPITLSVVVIEVARRLGVRLDGVGMPGHFLVGDPRSRSFFDPFHGSAELSVEDVLALFRRITDDRVAWDERYLDPTSTNAILERMLANLRQAFLRARDPVRSAIVARLRAHTASGASGDATTFAALN